MKTIVLKLTGQVQGVGFRFAAKRKADELNIHGYAKNTPDGGVEIGIQGENNREMIAWCQQGPPHAQVEKINTTEKEERNYGEFLIIR